ncbi:MAG: type II toxin-antitoxin system mRNA interferase toxin, RelE/StbE family [bacterium]|nr:type II toxin-antitoxin system mRNA interferase toxin, RelE/StbE family [bacterium]
MPKPVKQAFLEKEGLFLRNPFHSSLETHKLHGKYKEYWAFTVIGQYRIMFRFMDNDKDIGFVNIGTHKIYK